MERILMFKDTEKFNVEIKTYSKLIPAFQEILDTYLKMDLPGITGIEFQDLVNNTETFVFDKKTNSQELKFMGLPVDKKEASKLLVKDSNYYQLLEQTQSVKKAINWSYFLGYTDVIDNEVVLKREFINKLEDRYNIYAETPEEIRLYEFAKTILEAANNCFGKDKGKVDLANVISTIIDVNAAPYFHTGEASWQLRYYAIKNFYQSK